MHSTLSINVVLHVYGNIYFLFAGALCSTITFVVYIMCDLLLCTTALKFITFMLWTECTELA